MTAPKTQTLVDENGKLWDVPLAKVGEAVAKGWARPETDEEKAARVKTETFGTPGQQILTTAERAASSATFGLSDVAAGLVAPEYAKAAQAREDVNPTAATIGNVGGALAGGVGVAKLAAKALGAARAAKILGLTGSVAERAVMGGASNAAIGAVARVGENLGEAMLGDEKITAERLLAGAGEAALWGGGLGFAMPVAGAAIKAAATGTRAAVNKINDLTREWFAKGFNVQRGKLAKEIATDVSDDAAEAFRRLTRDAGTEAGFAYRQKALGNLPEVRDAMQKDLQSTLRKTIATFKRTSAQDFEEFRPAEIGELLGGKSLGSARADAERVVSGAKAALEEMRAKPELYSAKTTIARAEEVVDALDAKLFSLDGIDDRASLHEAMRDARRRLDDVVGLWKKSSITPEIAPTVDKTREIIGTFREHLASEVNYGEAAARNAKRNAAFADLKKAEKVFVEHFGKWLDKGQGTWKLQPTKVNAYLNRVGATRNEDAAAALSHYLDAGATLVDTVAENAAKRSIAVDKDGAASLIRKVQATNAEASDILEPASKLRALANAPFVTGMDPATMATAGAYLGGPVGAGVGALIGTASNPDRLAKMLFRVEGFSLRTVRNVTAAAERATKAAVGAGERLGAKGGGAVAARVIALDRGVADHDRHEHDDKVAAFRARSKQISGLVADPAKTAAKLAEGFAQLDGVAPKTKQALVEHQMRVLDYLAQTMPKDPLAAMGINPNVGKWTPSDQEISRWQRRVEAANNPRILLEELHDGVVSRETVETVKTLYPTIFDQIRQDVMRNAVEIQADMPYSARVNMSLIFDAPLDPSMRPEAVRRYQGSFAKTGGQAPRGSGRKLNVGSAWASPSERHAK